MKRSKRHSITSNRCRSVPPHYKCYSNFAIVIDYMYKFDFVNYTKIEIFTSNEEMIDSEKNFTLLGYKILLFSTHSRCNLFDF